MNAPSVGCEFCEGAGGEVLWQNAVCRVVAIDEPDYPGFIRVIANRHVRELTDLDPAERRALMDVAFAVEQAVRDVMQPDKVNMASLGNMTPHVHWHVIPRYRDDRHFPGPVWAAARREPAVDAERRERASRLGACLAARLGGG